MKMLKCLAIMAVILAAAQVESQETKPTTSPSGPTTTRQAATSRVNRLSASYCIGVEVARGFKRQGMDVDLDSVVKGMKDVLAGEKLQVTESEIMATLNAYASELRRDQAKARLASAIDNKNEGEAFLAANKTKEGVVTLPSGLQHKVLKAGEGKKPTVNDTVECRYRGTLINGTEFEDSERTGQPATFKVAEVIPGWREALPLMPVGSKWQLFIPPQLAYGQQGAGRLIGPNATLIFELELLAIK